MRRAQLAGALLLAAAAAGAAVSPRTTLAAGLAAWWWALGLVLGVFVNAWMHVLTGGAWGGPVRALASLLAPRLPWLLLGLPVVASGAGLLYPWAGQPAGEWARDLDRPAFAVAWLTPGWFTLRLAVYALAWWWATRPGSLRSGGRAAGSLIVYALATTLAGVDLLMSLLPGWRSSAFGLVLMATQALSGAAAVAAWTSLGPPWPAAAKVPVSRDLGNLLLMWCMTWGYLAFMQFLVIWAEDLPREIAWYLPRLQTGWQWIGVALVLLQLAVPFLVLLLRAVKDHPARLRPVAALLLASAALDAAWTVLPSVDAHDLNAWWITPLAVAGLALLLLAGIGPHRVDPAEKQARDHAKDLRHA